MKSGIFSTLGITVSLVFAFSGISYAVDKTFTTDGVISDGDVWDDVRIENGATVTMSGGVVNDNVVVLGTSTFNMTGGVMGSLDDPDFILGGSSIDCAGYSTTNIYGGEIWGLFYDMETSGHATLNLYGGNGYQTGVTAQEVIWLNENNSQINIYGYGFTTEDTGVGIKISGYWLDGSPLLVNTWTHDAYDHINFVPEPATLSLLGLCSIVLLKRRKS